MSETYIYLAILLTAFATYLPRFLGVFSSDFVNEEGKLFKFVSCISYGILAALIARIFIHPVGALEQTSTTIRLLAAGITIVVLFVSKKNVLFSSLFGVILFGILNLYFN
ncbi:MAG: AzlD domain-containing protein [Pelagibacterales bacterium]|jgi:branched-subunit amino acid transport protein|nr:AzlD domain-containing protein [Pelagibacterales bacterium]